MGQRALSVWIKVIICLIAVCGLVVYFVVIPSYGHELVVKYPEYAGAYQPWITFIWLTAIPAYIVLFLVWMTAENIGRDKSFSRVNAKYLKWIALLAAIDSVFFFVGNVVFAAIGISHPGVVLASLIVVFFGIAVSVISAAVSHLIMKAAKLQEENELTI
ncbi:MAG: DUF2975 domain-containing protein [Clostridia bacterium]|nr:DUF2975 domain-containing protein [Clostridia bacterium]